MSVSMINGHIDKHDSDRNKMIELLMSKSCIGKECPDVDCEKCEFIAVHTGDAEKISDYLLENGVIVQKKINGYEEYFIDELGNVYSQKSRRYINQQKGKDGYYYVQLCENGKRKRVAVHRLVAMNFIENPLDLPMVNHIDENRENNAINNLEWCTEKYNTNYGSARIKQAKAVSKAVVCIETGEVFFSQKEAGQIKGIAHQHICDCCKGKKQTCGGYHWRYATKEEAEAKLKGGVES